jgi:hypothetical protein
VDITLPTDRASVPEYSRHCFDGTEDVAFRLRIRIEFSHFLERASRENRSRPRSKVLGCEVLARGLPQVLIHVGRLDILNLVVLVEVLKELASGQLLTFADNPGQSWIVELDVMKPASLALEAKPKRRM